MQHNSQAFVIRKTQIVGQASYSCLDIKTTLSDISSTLKGPNRLTWMSMYNPCQMDVSLSTGVFAGKGVVRSPCPDSNNDSLSKYFCSRGRAG